MSFADSLARLRTAVLGHRGMRADKTVVLTRDLADLINHFDGLDRSMRERANLNSPTEKPKLTWSVEKVIVRSSHPTTSAECHVAWSDQLRIGQVCPVPGGIWFDATYAVHMRDIAKGSGHSTSVDEGKAAVELAWATWLQYAGLGQ